MSEPVFARPGRTGGADVQALEPATRVSLSRVGVTGVEKIIRIAQNGGEQLFYAEIECFVDLHPQQMGAHMSRFEEIVNETIDEVVLAEAFKAETLAMHIADRIRRRQQSLRAEASITARYPEHKQTPETGTRTQELYELIGTAVANERGMRRLVGVRAQGMTACPCAQSMVADRAGERLLEEGFSDDEIERVFAAVPVATHNQRGIGTLYLGTTGEPREPIEAQALLRTVESSMSSEIYELLKRPDELAVVEGAHRRPRFVEDCVREMVRGVVEAFPGLPDDSFVLAHQENLETIHRHNVIAERHGTLGELRYELANNEHLPSHTTREQWLEGN